MQAPTATGYAHLEPTQAPPWHGLVLWDVFFNALTTGLFLSTAVSELAAPDVFGGVARWAYPLALVLLLTDLTLLVLDLGSPERFHHMLRVFKPTSPMSLGTWCLTAYSVPLTILVVADLTGWAIGPLRTVLVVLTLPFAFGSMAYKGVLFSTSSQPGWRDARWLGAYHASSALALGSAVLLLIAVAEGEDRAVDALRPALAMLLILQCLPLILMGVELWRALAWRSGRGYLRLTAGIALYGVGVPLLMLVAVGRDGFATALATGFILVAGWVVRRAVIALPHAGSSHSQPTVGRM